MWSDTGVGSGEARSGRRGVHGLGDRRVGRPGGARRDAATSREAGRSSARGSGSRSRWTAPSRAEAPPRRPRRCSAGSKRTTDFDDGRRRRPRRRGGVRGPRGQGRALPAARRAARRASAARLQHLVDPDRPARLVDRAARSRARPALLLAGAGDEAGRGRRRPRDSDETVDARRGVRRAIGKTPIRTKDRSGFIVNMLLVPYLMAAVRMYEEGFATREASTRACSSAAGTRWAR